MGIIVSITGVSGAGKTTLAKEILARKSGSVMVESITTRLPRPSDISGEYHYVSQEVFEEMRKGRVFLWTATHGGTHYGTKAESISRIIKKDNTIGIMILVPEVLKCLREYLNSLSALSSHVPIFLITPPEDLLRQRLVERGDSTAIMSQRLKESVNWESEAIKSKIPFHFIKNDDIITKTVSEALTLF